MSDYEIEECDTLEGKLRRMRARQEREEFYANVIALGGIMLMALTLWWLGHLAWGW